MLFQRLHYRLCAAICRDISRAGSDVETKRAARQIMTARPAKTIGDRFTLRPIIDIAERKARIVHGIVRSGFACLIECHALIDRERRRI